MASGNKTKSLIRKNPVCITKIMFVSQPVVSNPMILTVPEKIKNSKARGKTDRETEERSESRGRRSLRAADVWNVAGS